MTGACQWRAAARARARRHALWRCPPAATDSARTRTRFFSTSTSSWRALRPRDVAQSPHAGHLSVCTSDAAAKNRSALARTQWLLARSSDADAAAQSRRVLVLSGGAAASPLRSRLARDNALFELERRGHAVLGVREFCQQMLRETGRERRVLERAQLAGFLLHHADALPVTRFHRGTAASSSLQRRKSVQDLLALFRLLESEAITPERYQALAADASHAAEAPADLAQAYAAYRELLAQHNASSWDGLVLDVLTLCGAERAPTVAGAAAVEPSGSEFTEAVLRGFTDVVLDDAQRLTPAMARLVGHLCAQPAVRSSTSFSRVLQDGDVCPVTRILEQQLRHAGGESHRSVLHATLASERASPPPTALQALAGRLLASPARPSDSKSAKTRPNTTTDKPHASTPPPSAALRCWSFESAEDELQTVGRYLAERLDTGGVRDVSVLCPTHADAQRVALAMAAQGLPVRLGDGQSAGAGVHLFDEPGVNAVYSLLCALSCPSDSRHLYNVLRSDLFAFPPELLARLMERERGSDADLFAVLDAFVSTRGTALHDSIRQHAGQAEEAELQRGLETATAFVALVRRLRGQMHQLSAVEIAQGFLEDTGRMQTLLDPSTPEQELEALALADFLRELETAARIVQSEQVAFVAPYLLQLRETPLSSSTARHELSPVLEAPEERVDAREPCVRVLPLTSYSLELLASTADTRDAEGAASATPTKLLVLMAMRDSKFPGRMKRLTLPLPYELLSEPFPVQTRAEHLERCEKLAFEALTVGGHDEAVLSFAALASSAASGNVRPKRETLSRVFLPIWHEERPPTRCPPGDSSSAKPEQPSRSDAAGSNAATGTANSQVASESESSTSGKTTDLWFSALTAFVRDVVQRFFVPASPEEAMARASKSSDPSHDVTEKTTESAAEHAAPSSVSRASAASTSTRPYEPSHLSYSQISEYLRCPHRYYLSRVMKLPGDVSTAMMFGRALHEGVAAFATRMSESSSIEPEELKALATTEAEDAFARAWAGDGHGLFTSSEQRQFLFDRGMKTLAGFMRAQQDDTELQEVVHVEHAFAFHVPEADVELRGVWDRIDRVALSSVASGLVIKEFKSNMGGAARDVRKLADASLQLKLYLYAFRQVFGEAPHGAVLQVIGCEDDAATERRKKPTARPPDKAFVHFSEEAEQEALVAVQQVAEGLRRADFEPTPSYAECAFCPYAGSACHVATDEAALMRRTAASTSRTG